VSNKDGTINIRCPEDVSVGNERLALVPKAIKRKGLSTRNRHTAILFGITFGYKKER
jgi:hypothetical protein